MASNFEIFEDQENFSDRHGQICGDIKRERTKLAPLTTKGFNNENAGEAQAFKSQKPIGSHLTNGGGNRAFKDKNFFAQNDIKGGKLIIKEEEESIINVTSDFLNPSSIEESSSSSFTYRKDTSNEASTPMSVSGSGECITPMSIDKTTLDEQVQKSIAIRNERDRMFEVAEYQRDILKYLKNIENQKNIRPRAEYMKKQPDINDSMRTILVDWLVEVGEEYHLNGETLFLAVHYIDRFLSHMSVVRAKLQLVGTTAMFVASKFEEIYPPEIGEFVYITDDTYTKQQVMRMEKLLLKVLSFDLSAPSMVNFITLYSTMMNIPDKIKHLAQYLCELSMLRATPFLNFLPSQTSSAAIALSYYHHGNSLWNKKMQDTFGYELDELKEVIIYLNEIHLEAEGLPQQAIQEKYKANKYMQASFVKPVKINAEDLDEIISKFSVGDELNTTAENIESVRQKTELLFN